MPKGPRRLTTWSRQLCNDRGIRRGIKPCFAAAAAIVHGAAEAQDATRLLRIVHQRAGIEPLILDVRGLTPLSKLGAEPPC